jgi:hypothetical protein
MHAGRVEHFLLMWNEVVSLMQLLCLGHHPLQGHLLGCFPPNTPPVG